jgi:hypothetical protein
MSSCAGHDAELGRDKTSLHASLVVIFILNQGLFVLSFKKMIFFCILNKDLYDNLIKNRKSYFKFISLEIKKVILTFSNLNIHLEILSCYEY